MSGVRGPGVHVFLLRRPLPMFYTKDKSSRNVCVQGAPYHAFPSSPP